MPDITLCLNHQCPIKQFCARYATGSSEFQSFTIFDHKNGMCEFFERKDDDDDSNQCG